MCHFYAVRNSIHILSSCEGLTKHGPAVYVDFYKINRPCNCILTSTFDDKLFVSSIEAINYECNTEVIVQNTMIFGYPVNQMASIVLNVNINQSVNVRANHASPYASGTFAHCMGFQQNGMKVYLSIFCTICCFVISFFIELYLIH